MADLTLDGLAAFVAALESDDFEAGRWHESEPLADGSITMPWYELSVLASQRLESSRALDLHGPSLQASLLGVHDRLGTVPIAP